MGHFKLSPCLVKPGNTKIQPGMLKSLTVDVLTVGLRSVARCERDVEDEGKDFSLISNTVYRTVCSYFFLILFFLKLFLAITAFDEISLKRVSLLEDSECLQYDI